MVSHWLLLATSLYDDPAAELHEDACARLREHLALRGCAGPRQSSGVSGYQKPRLRPRGERGRPTTESDRVFRTLRSGSAADYRAPRDAVRDTTCRGQLSLSVASEDLC